jgi:hypothetical protein
VLFEAGGCILMANRHRRRGLSYPSLQLRLIKSPPSHLFGLICGSFESKSLVTFDNTLSFIPLDILLQPPGRNPMRELFRAVPRDSDQSSVAMQESRIQHIRWFKPVVLMKIFCQAFLGIVLVPVERAYDRLQLFPLCFRKHLPPRFLRFHFRFV